MNKLIYAEAQDPGAQCILFGANTQKAGTAPTFSKPSERELFSADFIRQVDNTLYSLPENFKSGAQLFDAGNLPINHHSMEEEIELVSSFFSQCLENKQIPICLGGDHTIKYAALKALDHVMPGQYGVVYLDAHPDCEEQSRLSYSSILHHGFLLPSLKPQQIMLTGIRQFTSSEARALCRYQPEIGIIKGSEFNNTHIIELGQKIVAQFKHLNYLYFSIDLDGLDPSCAPAVESPYPGGPNLNQLLYLIHYLREQFTFVGMDISEFIPYLDTQHITALCASRILKEFYSVI
ncbi:arginase family protein [Legionella quateirensis]|uniref:Formimidoylglutamase n=1 Tax=Legionella quateirensis TaxID=45072 RepID=A0A378KTS0_9GAMM|nr:arginase family protein [Legionella quateirensis]KTD44694.1 formiminoglutamase [Legionella quateirensis]STY16788.1 formimidoylglutamase [Legionella quateirensis]